MWISTLIIQDCWTEEHAKVERRLTRCSHKVMARKIIENLTCAHPMCPIQKYCIVIPPFIQQPGSNIKECYLYVIESLNKNTVAFPQHRYLEQNYNLVFFAADISKVKKEVRHWGSTCCQNSLSVTWQTLKLYRILSKDIRPNHWVPRVMHAPCVGTLSCWKETSRPQLC